MTMNPRNRDWQVLGLEPGANPREVRRSYLERKNLYSADSVASYSLFEDQDRESLLEKIEEAYQRIIGTPAPPVLAGNAEEPLPDAPAGPPPSLDDEPGGHLRHHRLRLGLLLAQVAAEIKVRASLLEKLEEQDFSYLPAAVYVRGFVVQYARHLGLDDPEGIAVRYLDRMEREHVAEK
jgi:flagellar biosynthesis protein FlhG